MKLYFIRHGETDDNKTSHVQGRKDNELNDKGRAQALEKAYYLKNLNVPFSLITSSPLKRAYESAQIINSVLNIGKIIVLEDLNERDFGVLEGMDVNEYKHRENINCAGYESDEEIISRVLRCAIKLASIEGNVIAVCHSHTIKALLHAIDENYSFYYPLPNLAVVEIEYTDEFGILSIN